MHSISPPWGGGQDQGATPFKWGFRGIAGGVNKRGGNAHNIDDILFNVPPIFKWEIRAWAPPQEGGGIINPLPPRLKGGLGYGRAIISRGHFLKNSKLATLLSHKLGVIKHTAPLFLKKAGVLYSFSKGGIKKYNQFFKNYSFFKKKGWFPSSIQIYNMVTNLNFNQTVLRWHPGISLCGPSFKYMGSAHAGAPSGGGFITRPGSKIWQSHTSLICTPPGEYGLIPYKKGHPPWGWPLAGKKSCYAAERHIRQGNKTKKRQSLKREIGQGFCLSSNSHFQNLLSIWFLCTQGLYGLINDLIHSRASLMVLPIYPFTLWRGQSPYSHHFFAPPPFKKGPPGINPGINPFYLLKGVYGKAISHRANNPFKGVYGKAISHRTNKGRPPGGVQSSMQSISPPWGGAQDQGATQSSMQSISPPWGGGQDQGATPFKWGCREKGYPPWGWPLGGGVGLRVKKIKPYKRGFKKSLIIFLKKLSAAVSFIYSQTRESDFLVNCESYNSAPHFKALPPLNFKKVTNTNHPIAKAIKGGHPIFTGGTLNIGVIFINPLPPAMAYGSAINPSGVVPGAAPPWGPFPPPWGGGHGLLKGMVYGSAINPIKKVNAYAAERHANLALLSLRGNTHTPNPPFKGVGLGGVFMGKAHKKTGWPLFLKGALIKRSPYNPLYKFIILLKQKKLAKIESSSWPIISLLNLWSPGPPTFLKGVNRNNYAGHSQSYIPLCGIQDQPGPPSLICAPPRLGVPEGINPGINPYTPFNPLYAEHIPPLGGGPRLVYGRAISHTTNPHIMGWPLAGGVQRGCWGSINLKMLDWRHNCYKYKKQLVFFFHSLLNLALPSLYVGGCMLPSGGGFAHTNAPHSFMDPLIPQKNWGQGGGKYLFKNIRNNNYCFSYRERWFDVDAGDDDDKEWPLFSLYFNPENNLLNTQIPFYKNRFSNYINPFKGVIAKAINPKNLLFYRVNKLNAGHPPQNGWPLEEGLQQPQRVPPLGVALYMQSISPPWGGGQDWGGINNNLYSNNGGANNSYLGPALIRYLLSEFNTVELKLALMQNKENMKQIYQAGPDYLELRLHPPLTTFGNVGVKGSTFKIEFYKGKFYLLKRNRKLKIQSKINKKNWLDELFSNPKRYPTFIERHFTRNRKKLNLLIRSQKLIKKLINKSSDPKLMTLTVLPVLPPELRPIVKMDGQVAAADLNRLYQRIIYRNDRLKKLLNNSVMRQSYLMHLGVRLLQESVDNLISNGKSGVTPEKDSRDRLLKSLSDILKGKEGRFRQYLLGKRVDYSGRSVIVVGPSLQLHECGIPKEMAFELFLPFLLKTILNQKLARTVIGAKKLLKKHPALAWELLQETMETSPVLLNRAPTLHRLGIQAFKPKLIEGKAILLHPLVCSAFNADFDGDQMAVHIPLTVEARAEAWKLMLSINNLLSPATGEPLAIPSQDMVLGCYYLTTNCNEHYIKYQKGSGLYFTSFIDVLQSYENKKLDLHAIIWLKWNGYLENGNDQNEPLEIRINSYGNYQEIYPKFQRHYSKENVLINQYIATTPGKVLFNFMVKQTLKL
jgi:hypothetical protein